MPTLYDERIRASNFFAAIREVANKEYQSNAFEDLDAQVCRALRIPLCIIDCTQQQIDLRVSIWKRWVSVWLDYKERELFKVYEYIPTKAETRSTLLDFSDDGI